MTSPFPGMNPFLEGSDWSSFHVELCVEIGRQLRSRLSPRYVALVEKRIVSESVGEIGIAAAEHRPDVAVAAAERIAEQRVDYGTAVLDAPVTLAAPWEADAPQHFVEIRTVDDRELVTVIELLSPSNKQGDGRDAYLRKRRKVLRSQASLVEIDLLRAGARVPMQQPLPDADYFVIVHPAGRRPMAGVWPIGLRDTLPTIPVPLRPPDSDVKLDLQEAFACAFDLGGFERVVRYSTAPREPFREADAAWVDEIVARLRTARGQEREG